MSSALVLSEVVSVNITLLSAAVPQPAFGVPLILGTSNRYTGGTVVKFFSTAASMLVANGGDFMSNDPEYLKAIALDSQGLLPSTFAVGSQAVASVAQINTITVNTATASDVYTVTVNGQPASYTAGGGDAVADIAIGLVAAINALTGANVLAAHTSGGAFTITSYNSEIQVASTSQGANWPGLAFIATLGGTGGALMSQVLSTANASIVTGLQAIQAVNQGFYCINLCSTNWYDILNMATYIESQVLVYIAYSADAAVALNTCTHDVLSILMGKDYNRTALLYTGDAAAEPDSAWTGANVPLPVGQSTWGNVALIGVTPDNLSQTQFNTIAGKPGTTIAKNGNVYIVLGGNNVVLWGQAVSGRFLDITIGIDWLTAEIQGNIWASMVAARAAGGKIPYTNAGATIFVGNIKEAIDLGASQGLINEVDYPVVITAQTVQSQSLSNRTSRIAPPISFSCTLAGAFSTATVNGVLSV